MQSSSAASRKLIFFLLLNIEVWMSTWQAGSFLLIPLVLPDWILARKLQETVGF